MWKVQEILEQLEFERKRHMKMSGLVDDFEVSMEHLEAADRVMQAIKIIKCSIDCGKPDAVITALGLAEERPADGKSSSTIQTK